MILALLLAAVAQETPAVDGAWWRLAAPPKLERFATGKEQTVDFTIFRAKDGTWQLISCIRGTSQPGSGRLLYRWEGAKLTDPDWTPRGIFMTADLELGHREGKLQAPHCVVEDDTWWLFFSSGGAHAFTSSDGKTFAPARTVDGSTKFFDMPRDLSIFDNRARDGKWYAFFTDIRPGEYPDRKNHTVSYRTAEKLAGPWSAKATDIGTVSDPPKGYLFVFAESPFVHHRDGWFYRLEQLNVLASRSLDEWKGPRIAWLGPKNLYQYLAPELVVDGDVTYLAAYKNHGKQGIHLAKLAWTAK